MAFDGIVTKSIASELQQLTGARIDKIFQPDKNTIILGFYKNGKNYALNICIDSQNYRIHLTTHSKANPKVAPNFCMVLRKHLIGLHIKNFITNNLERLIIIEFEGLDEIDDIISKKLIIELMGKHCNIVLLDDCNIIIDSLRHIIPNDNSNRNVVPHIKYSFPTTNKYNFLAIKDFHDFKEKLFEVYSQSQSSILSDKITIDVDSLSSLISNTFNGISKNFIKYSIEKLNIFDFDIKTLEIIYNYIKEIINRTDSLNLNFEDTLDNKNNKRDYILVPNKSLNDSFHLNFYIDDFYFAKESSENFKIYRNSVLKLILNVLKKYNKRLSNINEKIQTCDNMDIYKLYGELITANLYKIKDSNENIDKIELENYYDNNKLITIPLDKKYSPAINAKRYFKKYNKLKNTLEIVSIQKEETIKELNYIESIVYELENCSSIEEISDIFEEISENVIFKEKTDNYKKKKYIKVKKSNLTKNKNVSFNPIKYNLDGFILLVGRNNKENDYLTLKYAKKNDLWFHTKNIHGSHAVLLLSHNISSNLSKETLIKCAQITAYHSKAKNSSNVLVDYCEIKYVKKPKGAKPGMVIYSNNKTLNVNPKK